ncbi:hypothetical protein JZ751_020597 [Albula glossodonta]|uniref:E3 ubiquitin-protein ligase Arkadia N-terminal domain-containing protein n=1 Tax=Albula glossodonta TaxID=121402 RepID=A0A8T2PI72_9TELE|nr:hypothetical protein JZ751_020597 [Albula glossodonta]
MKSEIPSDAAGRHEHLKGALANPEPMEAAKSFPADMEVISKVGSEFAPLCTEARHRPLREVGPGARRDSDRGLSGRKKRKSQQAGPGPSDCALKEGRVTGGPLAPSHHRSDLLEGRSEDERHPESSFSDCASSPSSSLHFGDSDTLTSEEEGEGGEEGGAVGVAEAVPQQKVVAGVGGATGDGIRPVVGRTRASSRPHKWARADPEPLLLKRPCLSTRRPPQRKRFVKAGPGVGTGVGTGGVQRTQKQKERLQLQRRKREVIARRKYALLHSTSSSSEELSSDSSSASSTEGEDELYVDVSSGSSQPGSATMATGALDEDVVVIDATPAPLVPASEEINVTSTDSEVEIVTVGDSYRPLGNLRVSESRAEIAHLGADVKLAGQIISTLPVCSKAVTAVALAALSKDEPCVVTDKPLLISRERKK